MVEIVTSLGLLFGENREHGFCKNLDSAKRIERSFKPHKGEKAKYHPIFQRTDCGFKVYLEVI